MKNPPFLLTATALGAGVALTGTVVAQVSVVRIFETEGGVI